jgi:hypothetical protein
MGRPDDFPDDVQQFLLDRITSVDQLEALLMLRAEPAREWSAAEVGRALYTQPEAAAARLTALVRSGLLAGRDAEGGHLYRYAPAAPEAAGLVTRLAELYPRCRVRVVATIYSKQNENVRAFADAFRWREGK